MKIGYKNQLEYAIVESPDTLAGYSTDSLTTNSTIDVYIPQSKSAMIYATLPAPTHLTHFYMSSNVKPNEGTAVLNIYPDNTFTTPSDTIDLGTYGHATIDVTAQYIGFEIINRSFGIPFLTIGQLYIGDVVELPPVSAGGSLAWHSTDNRAMSLSGQVYGTRGYIYRKPTFNFKNLSFQQIEVIKDVFEIASTIKPVWLSIWDDYEPLYVVIENPVIDFVQGEVHPTWSTTFTVREVY